MGSTSKVAAMREARGEWNMCAVTTVPYECDITTTRSSPKESRMDYMDWQVTCRSVGGDVMRELIGIISMATIPTSGSWEMNSARKGKYGHNPIPMP